jgi:uncharacterized protein YkwD
MLAKLFVLFFCIFFASACVSNAQPTPTQLGDLLNKIRLEHNLSTVKHSNQLSNAAQKHAEDMARNNYFSHTGQNGSEHYNRIKDAGYKACYSAENIAFGQKTTTEVMKAWMNSPGHRANNLSPRAKEFGLGRSGNIWVLLFGAGCTF